MKLIDIVGGTPFPTAYKMSFLHNFWREPLLRRLDLEFGIVRPEFTILLCLDFRSPLNARDICEITEQPANTISRGVASLERKGLISRTRDMIDLRRVTLSLTGRGRELIETVSEFFREGEQAMLQSLSAEEVAMLDALLDRMARDVGNWSGAGAGAGASMDRIDMRRRQGG